MGEVPSFASARRARFGSLALFFALPLACNPFRSSPARIRIACVGDSITEGATLARPAVESYPARLGELLGDGYQVSGFGVGGATLLRKGDKPWREQPAFSKVEDFEPDIVVILLGTNDAKPHNFGPHGGDFVRDYVALVRELGALPSHPKVLAVSPPPAFPGKWDIADGPLARDIAPRVEQAAREARIGFVDLRAALAGRGALFPDTVHPNAEGARAVAAAVRDGLGRAATPER
jgi:lysophospholipase L1-like esterase